MVHIWHIFVTIIINIQQTSVLYHVLFLCRRPPEGEAAGSTPAGWAILLKMTIPL